MRRRRLFLLVTGGLIAAGVAAGIVITLKPAPGAADPHAGLAAAAQAVGFHSTMDDTVGKIEKLHAQDAPPTVNPSLLAVGTRAPDFELETPTGQRVRLSDFAGKAVFLEFFTTWCPHCQAEAQHLVALRAALPKSIIFLSVNADGEDAASVYAFDQFFGIPYPTLLDPGGQPGSFNKRGTAGPVTKSYNVFIYPTFYIIDRNGFVAWRSDGEQPDDLVMKQLRLAARH